MLTVAPKSSAEASAAIKSANPGAARGRRPTGGGGARPAQLQQGEGGEAPGKDRLCLPAKPAPWSAVPDLQHNPLHFQPRTCPCGGGCPKCAGRSQAFVVGEPGSRSELEADRFASSGGALTAASASGPPLSSPASELVERALDFSDTQSLPAAAAHQLEPRLPAGAASARLHTGGHAHAAAHALGANAFTTGNHIVFAGGHFSPHTKRGRNLLAHELAHVAQQRSLPAHAPALIQKQPANTAASVQTDDDQTAVEEPPKYKWINYDKAAALNRHWFDVLRLADANPLSPFDPVSTPNAFINRVVAWQLAVHRQTGAEGSSFAQFVFAASREQSKIHDPTGATILSGMAQVSKSVREGSYHPGHGIGPDGVLGPATLWTMLVAASLAANPAGLKLLQRARIPVEMVQFNESLPGALEEVVRNVHAFEFNPPHFKATWKSLASSDAVFTAYENLFSLDDDLQTYLINLFFDGQSPQNVKIETPDLVAIAARGYKGEALEVLASLAEVDRSYLSPADFERLELLKAKGWRLDSDPADLRMAVIDSKNSNYLIQALDLVPPQTSAAKAALERLDKSDGHPAAGEPLSILMLIVRLPARDPQFWKNTAQQYVNDKLAAEKAAADATAKYLAGLETQFKARMQGEPDITKKDAAVFVELLTGDAYGFAQKRIAAQNSTPIPGVALSWSYQPETAGDRVSQLYHEAVEKQYLIVQLSDDKNARFPLPLRQIESSRQAAWRKAQNDDVLVFDMLGTVSAAFHYYLPHRFTAKSASDGAVVAQNPYELSDAKNAHAYEAWRYFTGRHYASLEPVLIEVNQFNSDATMFVKWGRQLFGTERIQGQFFWTLGGSLPALSEQLWHAQGTINLSEWVDAVMTVIAMSSLVSAPLAAGDEAAGSTAAAELGQEAINAAISKALGKAVEELIINQALAQSLNWLSGYINSAGWIPADLKKAWNGLMVGLMIYGGAKFLLKGLKMFRGLEQAPPDFRTHIEGLEAELQTSLAAGQPELNAAERAAESEIETNAAQEFTQATGPDEPTGAGRVRSDDPRLQAVSAKPEAVLSDADSASLRQALGDELADKFEAATGETAQKRLVDLQSPEAMRKLAAAFKPKVLARMLATVETKTLAAFADHLESAPLTKLLKALATKPAGVRLMSAFASDPGRLSALLDAFDGRNLLSLAENPGAERLFQVAASVEPGILGRALKTMGQGRAGSMTRFRNLLKAVGPERTAEVLNTYTPGEIRGFWRARGGLSAAQRVAALAIEREGVPTVRRAALGGLPVGGDSRPNLFHPDDIGTFYAIGPESEAPPRLRGTVDAVQKATAAAATHLEEVISRYRRGQMTSADIKALPDIVRQTAEAFTDAGGSATNRKALYGTAIQYLTEAKLKEAYGGTFPPNVEMRKPTTGGLIPDMVMEVTLEGQTGPQGKPATMRVVFDWTTAKQAGKIGKYAGGRNPAAYGIEIIQPGPPDYVAPPRFTPTVIPKKIGDPGHITPPPPPPPPEKKDDSSSESHDGQ